MTYDTDLQQLQQKVALKKQLEAKLNDLREQRKVFDKQVIELRVAHRSEQEDVEKLEGKSLAELICTRNSSARLFRTSPISESGLADKPLIKDLVSSLMPQTSAKQTFLRISNFVPPADALPISFICADIRSAIISPWQGVLVVRTSLHCILNLFMEFWSAHFNGKNRNI